MHCRTSQSQQSFISFPYFFPARKDLDFSCFAITNCPRVYHLGRKIDHWICFHCKIGCWNFKKALAIEQSGALAFCFCSSMRKTKGTFGTRQQATPAGTLGPNSIPQNRHSLSTCQRICHSRR